MKIKIKTFYNYFLFKIAFFELIDTILLQTEDTSAKTM